MISTNLKALRGGVSIAALIIGSAQAGELPAVSAPVLTVDASAGSVGGDASGYASMMGTIPVTHETGFQLDALVGQNGERGQGGLGGHYFWRDPDIGMAGASAMWSRIGGWNMFRYGVEFESYLGDFTIAPSFGVQRGDVNRGTTGYGSLELSWYATDTLKLSVGASGFSQSRGGFVGGEWQPMDESPLSLFAVAGAGNEGEGFGLSGIRYVFGAGKSDLKHRNRHGDPENIVRFSNVSGGTSAAIAARAQAVNAAPPTATVAAGGGGGCFIAGTLVLMADKTVKSIEDVAVGDAVLGADGAVNLVEKLHRPLLGGLALYSFNDGPAFVTDDHPFMTRDGWKAIDPAAAEKTNPGLVKAALAVGDVLRTHDGETPLTLLQARAAAADTQLYNFTVSGNRSFHVKAAASFLLVHNK